MTKTAAGPASAAQRGAASATTVASAPTLRLQRRCGCGGSAPGLTGECDTCRRARLRLQPKLVIGAVNDPMEREADAAAAQVMGDMKGPVAALRSAGSDPGARHPDPVQPALPALQRAAPPTASEAALEAGGEAPASVHELLAQPGRSLDAASRSFFEPRFGRDFSAVRVHDDVAADRAARSVGARAFTVGQHIAFAAGQQAPALLAHELAHTVQQGGAPPRLQRAPWGPCPEGQRVDPRGSILKKALKKDVKGAASAFKLYTTAELAAVEYYIFHPMNAGHCMMTNVHFATGTIPDSCRGFDYQIAAELVTRFHAENKTRKRPIRWGGENVGERVEEWGGAVGEAAEIVDAILQPDIVDITAREVYDITTDKQADVKLSKLKFTYAARLSDLVPGLMFKPGQRALGPGPLGGTIKAGAYTICYGPTDFAVHPGVIQYVALDTTKSGPDGGKKKGDEKKGQEQKKDPAKKSPGAGKLANVGLGFGIGSTSSGAGNAGVGVSVMSHGTSFFTVSGGIVYDSHGFAVASVGAAAAARSEGAGAGNAGAGAQKDSSAIGAGNASLTKGGGNLGAAAGTASRGQPTDQFGAQAGRAGQAGAESTSGIGGSSGPNGTDARVSADAGTQVDGESGKEPGASQQPSGGALPGGAADAGTGARSARDGVGRTDAGVGSSAGGEGVTSVPATDGGSAPALQSATPGAAGGAAGIKPLLDIPGATSAEVQAAIEEAARIDARLQKASGKRRELLNHLARTEGLPDAMIPDAAWVDRMLDLTEGLSDGDLERLQQLDWTPGDADLEQAKQDLRSALAASASSSTNAPTRPAKTANVQQPAPVPGTPRPAEDRRPKKDEPDEAQLARWRRLAQRAREYGAWATVARSPMHAQVRWADGKPGEVLQAELYVIVEDAAGKAPLRLTADLSVSISESGGRRTMKVLSHSELVASDGTAFTGARLQNEFALVSE